MYVLTSDIIRNGGRVSWIIFWDSVNDLADQVSSDISSLWAVR